MNKVLFLELNEFNTHLLETAGQKFENIKKLTSLYKTDTFSHDTYESDFLEPWVQWVSVHTGVPREEHQIKHLGDVPHLEGEQFWEKLSKMGKTSGIWGAMNASRSSAEHCLFFLPDPWTASEIASPQELNALLDPLRYATKNYLNHSPKKLLKETLSLLRFIQNHKLGKQLLKEIPPLLKNCLQYKGEHFPFIVFTEYLSTLLFQKYMQKYEPDFSLIFINSLAHLQHHHWHGFEYENNQRLQIGLGYIDRILKILFDSLKEGDIFIATNALSQENTNHEKPWILYRQIDQEAFLKAAHIPYLKVESHMTHDAHLFFHTKEECAKAFDILQGAKILNQPLFLIERYQEDPTKLFYRLVFTDKIAKETTFTINGIELPFFSLFKEVVQRTGKHIPHGTLYCNQPLFKETIPNHAILTAIL